MTVLRKVAQRSWNEHRLFLEALASLCWVSLLLEVLPFRKLAPRLGASQQETPTDILPDDQATVLKISWAVQAVARHVSLGFVCLPQAMAAQRMLRRRGIRSTLYLGVAPDRADARAIQAHAWLRAGDKIVTGEREAANHRQLASFAD